MYLIILLQAALSATAVALVTVSPMYELPYMSEILMSHANGLPRVRGVRVAPLGFIISVIIVIIIIIIIKKYTFRVILHEIVTGEVNMIHEMRNSRQISDVQWPDRYNNYNFNIQKLSVERAIYQVRIGKLAGIQQS